MESVHERSELRYLVCIDGVPDREDTPYRDGGVALNDARAIKRANPDALVTVQVIFEESE